MHKTAIGSSVVTVDEYRRRLAKNVRCARKVIEISQEELARRIGRDRSTVTGFELLNQSFSLEELPILAEALELSNPMALYQVAAFVEVDCDS